MQLLNRVAMSKENKGQIFKNEKANLQEKSCQKILKLVLEFHKI